MYENTDLQVGNIVRIVSFSYEGEDFSIPYEDHGYELGAEYPVVGITPPEDELFPIVLPAPLFYNLQFHPDMLEKVSTIRKRKEE